MHFNMVLQLMLATCKLQLGRLLIKVDWACKLQVKKKARRKHVSNNNGQQLAGKIAVITGGSSGIGLATAKRFVEEGAHVVITGRREKELKEAAAFIKRNVTTVTGDVSRLEDLDRLYAVVKEKHGHIDILFANA